MRLRLGLIALFAATAAPAAAQESMYIFSVPAQRATAASGWVDDPIRATLHVSDPEKAERMIRGGGAMRIVDSGAKTVTVLLDARPTLGREPVAADRLSSFVIDYNEESVRELVTSLRGDHGAAPGIDDLVRFVDTHIDDKNYLGSFDFASRVAATGAGDCTEHAVLLTALSRASGYPARVALGVLLVETERGFDAFGHAWSEIHDGEAWRLADATWPADSGDDSADDIGRARYLPLITLQNEGPGYAMDLMRLMSVQPSRISDIDSANPIGN